MQSRSSLPTSFTSLSQELHDLIYEFALVANEPIVVFDGKLSYIGWQKYDEATGDVLDSSIMAGEPNFKYEKSKRDPQLQRLAYNLLRCPNMILARKAANIFYGRNTFVFIGDHNWDPIVSWLQSIGDQNLNCLTKLNIEARHPDISFQRRDGSRVALPHVPSFWPIYPRNPHLYVHSGPLMTGAVDNINPAIETLMAILGKRKIRKVLEISMLLEYDNLPGFEMMFSSNQSGSPCSSELPDLLEKFRAVYTDDASGQSSVKILWKGETSPRNFDERRSEIEESGWEIIELIEKAHLPQPPTQPTIPRYFMAGTLFSTLFTVQRRHIKGKLWASPARAYGEPEDQY